MHLIVLAYWIGCLVATTIHSCGSANASGNCTKRGMALLSRSIRKHILSFCGDVSEPCRNRTLPDYIPHNFPNGVKGHNLEDAAPQTSSADVSGLHISDRSELVFAPKIPAPVTSHSEPNPPLSDRNKISYRHRHLLEVAKAKFDAAVSDLAESKKKAINPAFWQMTTRKVGVEVNKKANIVNAFRSQLFKLEYPEIAATMEIPKKLTKRMHTSMLVEYRAKKRAAQTLTHDLIKNRAEVPKRQRVRKNKARNLKAKEATAPTSGLAGGGSTDNPITID